MDYISFYNMAFTFLSSHENVGEVLLTKHLKTPRKENDLNKIYYRLCFSAQNRQMSNNVIGGAIGGFDNLGRVLYKFNPKRVVKEFNRGDGRKLLKEVVLKLKPKGKVRQESNSIWPKYCETVIQAAHFLNKFNDGNEFHKFVKKFTSDTRAIIAIPQLISTSIDGIGFPLACDFLKEIGCKEFGKPDVHIKDIFRAAGFLKSNYRDEDFEAFQILVDMASQNNKSAYEIDKLIWLIGSGNFYRNDLIIGSQKSKFISIIKRKK